MKKITLLSLLSLVIICSSFAQEYIQQMVDRILNQHNCGHYHFHETPALCQVLVNEKTLELYLEFDHQEDIASDLYDHLLESFLPALDEFRLKQLNFFVKTKDESKYNDLAHYFPHSKRAAYYPPQNKDPFPDLYSDLTKGPGNPHQGQVQPTGSLAGKTVWLSPGHGWKADNSNNNWLTQRGNTNDYVEDFGTVGGIDYYLQRYLYNAGANVWVVRERDVNTNEVVVNNDDGAPTYTETGAWTTSGSTGYNGSTYRFVNSAATEDATAIYTPTFTEEGWYWVSVYYREGANRSADTRYKINHAGGQTIVSINQEIHGQTWVYLGEYYFDAGSSGSVVLSNESNEIGQAIIADAVRFGGGMGSTTDCTFGGSPSGRPRFEEAARQYAQFQNYPTCENDVVIRPHYAEWELAKGTTTEQANAVYLSWHTNAFDGTADGTVTFAYDGTGSNPVTTGSYDFRDFVHAELASDILNGWDANWNDRGTNQANFGELRELTTMPGCLVEVAFHDNPDDVTALKTPAFRNLATRAMYQGIVKFFNDRDGSPIDLLPEPPTHLYAKNSNTGEVTVTWNAPTSGGGVVGDAATGYKVYLSTHGKGFADGIAVTGTSATFTGLQPSTTYYFQVTATNAGGESFPSATVAARTPAQGSTPAYLIVDGFDRLDRFGAVSQFESTALGTVDRMFLERMNRYDYMVEHARGLEYCDVAFDGTANEVVVDPTFNLCLYQGVDWITGEESTADFSLDTDEQAALIHYLDDGGNLIISGAEIGWDIGRSSSANASQSFYNNYLKSTYVGDDGQSYDFTGSSGDIFDGLSGTFDDSNNYDVEFPDRISPFGGATTVLEYVGGTGDGAGIAYKGSDFGVINVGFPLETIVDAATRNAIICEAVTYLTPNASCPFNLNLATSYPNGQVQYITAGNTISSSNTIVENGAIVVMDAGTTLCLDAGFEVELGGEFEGKIGGCGN